MLILLVIFFGVIIFIDNFTHNSDKNINKLLNESRDRENRLEVIKQKNKEYAKKTRKR